MEDRHPAIYILANRRNGTLYVGVTNNLVRRVYEHKFANLGGFAKRYNCNQLVYYEIYDDMYSAICREKEIKAGSRKKKLALIESINPEWIDLYDGII
jgi:predicted GIY-YIG superfamily endonuclease